MIPKDFRRNRQPGNEEITAVITAICKRWDYRAMSINILMHQQSPLTSINGFAHVRPRLGQLPATNIRTILRIFLD